MTPKPAWILGHLEKFFSPSRCESDSLTAMGHGGMERASHGADGPFMHFLDLNLEDPVPDATTIWLFREALAQAGLIDKLFERFGQHLEAEGYIARGGQIIDATIVSVPKQRNTKEENEAIK